jgi:Spy/CpxP family protein refolding chaperone
MKLTTKLFLPIAALMATAVFASAQDDNNRGDRRGNFEEFRQRMAERLKTSLKVTDEEWTVLQPLIEKVQTKQRDSMMGRFSGFGGRRGGGDGGSGGGGSTTGGGDRGRGDRGGDRAGSAESQALRTALESESTSSDEIKAKLAALREAQKKSAAELAAAREDLRKVVTVRQEAVLVTMGILE